MRCCRRDLWRLFCSSQGLYSWGKPREARLKWNSLGYMHFFVALSLVSSLEGFGNGNELATRCWMLFPWNISWCAGRWWSQWVVMATFQLLFVMKVIWFDTLWATLMRLWLYSFSHYLEIYLVEISVHFYRFMCMYMYEWKHTPMAPFV